MTSNCHLWHPFPQIKYFKNHDLNVDLNKSEVKVDSKPSMTSKLASVSWRLSFSTTVIQDSIFGLLRNSRNVYRIHYHFLLRQSESCSHHQCFSKYTWGFALPFSIFIPNWILLILKIFLLWRFLLGVNHLTYFTGNELFEILYFVQLDWIPLWIFDFL